MLHALCYGTEGWETAHVKVRQAIYNHIAETKHIYKHLGEHIADTKMSSLTTESMGVELMAAAQVLGIDIYAYHQWEK